MCLLCSDSNWFLETARAYLTGAWPRKFLEENPKIIANHASAKIPDQKKFFDDMDAMVKKHGSGEKAIAVLEAEIKPIVRQWRIDNNHWIPEDHPEGWEPVVARPPPDADNDKTVRMYGSLLPEWMVRN